MNVKYLKQLQYLFVHTVSNSITVTINIWSRSNSSINNLQLNREMQRRSVGDELYIYHVINIKQIIKNGHLVC